MSDRKNIMLVAEDDDNDFWFFEMAFKKAGGDGSVFRARDGTEVISYLAGECQYSDRRTYPLPDLLLLDLKMPRKTGFEVLEWLQTQPQLQHLPAVILSSSEEPRDIEQAYQLGVKSYLVKPRQYEQCTRLVQLIQEYWLEWNRPREAAVDRFPALAPALPPARQNHPAPAIP